MGRRGTIRSMSRLKKDLAEARRYKATTKPDAAPKKTSALDAAAMVLKDSTEGMNAKDLINAMSTKGLWTSPGGKTPHATLFAAIMREMKTKGNASRFVKAERGKFMLATQA